MGLNNRFLIAPLNWGLGHATRCIPIIRSLINQNANVSIAGDGESLKLLQAEFPRLNHYSLPRFDIQYPDGDKVSFLKGGFYGISQLSKFRNHIRSDHEAIQSLVESVDFDMVISDNRYGVHTDKVKSVIITHQIGIKAGPYSRFVNRKVRTWLGSFNEVWIPDYPIDGISGALGHDNIQALNHRFIGPLSRLTKEEEPQGSLVVIISGPSPQKERMLDKILNQIKRSLTFLNRKFNRIELIYPEEKKIESEGIKVHYAPSQQQLNQIINRADLVIARSGYSTIMDLIKLQKPALLIPTPGQPEQIYLARYHYEQGNFQYIEQKSLDLKVNLDNMIFNPPRTPWDEEYLTNTITSILK